jgi:DNA repair photolyase
MSSSTDPFVPQEFKYGITKSILQAMVDRPPDILVLQTHTHLVEKYLDIYQKLKEKCEMRVHISLETDREEMEGLPSHASPIAKRFAAAKALKEAGIRTVITISPLLPIEHPEAFFARIAKSADAVVIDHFIGGDGSSCGQRTLKTRLPQVLQKIAPESLTIEYRDSMVEIAQQYIANVGVSIDGFAARYLGREKAPPKPKQSEGEQMTLW